MNLRNLLAQRHRVLPKLFSASKESNELAFWKSRYEMDKRDFQNMMYERIMLGMAERSDAGFLTNKSVGDFGCGPRGSLVWARPAAIRVGIDLLVSEYLTFFTNSLLSHGMIYVQSTEKYIPIPDGFFDVLFTLNAMDHVANFPQICSEVLRIIRPGGEFIGSFNLREPATTTEPLTLNENLIRAHLLNHLSVISYRVGPQGHLSDRYCHMLAGDLSNDPTQPAFLWVRAIKP